jgi:nucleotide-binding universal stress UspA family protein
MTTFPRTILVGHDFSKRADRAVRRARQLSEADSRTVVFHAASEPRAIDALKDRLASRVRVIMAPASDARITVEVLHDVPHAAAKRLAEEHQVDLLVMGLHGKKRILEIFRTSTLNRMISALDVPTLIARTSPPKPYRHILVGIDFAVS